MTSVRRFFESTVVLDGGVGTGLMAHGLEHGHSSEQWNLECPELVQAVHASHYAAGSHVVQTNTFGANANTLRNHGLESRVEEVNFAAAQIARRAADEAGGKLVSGDIGPSGVLLPPVGQASPNEIGEAFAVQAAALERGGVDYISIETMTDLKEALLALNAARSATTLPVSVTLSFDKKPRGFFTMMGDTPEKVVSALVESGAFAVGANCSVGSETLLELAPRLVDASSVPVILKPNAGLPELIDGKTVYSQSPDQFAEDLAAAVRLGVTAVGGCCGTTEQHIRALCLALG